MELYRQLEDVQLVGIEVKTFPLGINEAFGDLMKVFGRERAYYGVSWCDEDDNIKYYAMTSAPPVMEPEHGYDQITLVKGDYKAEALRNWRQKTNCIKDIFQRLMPDSKPTKGRPCIEWYHSDEEMLCMIRVL